MSSGHGDEEPRKDYRSAYSPKHPIPTVQQYRNFKDQQKTNLLATSETGEISEEDSHRGEGIQRWFSKSSDNHQSAPPDAGSTSAAANDLNLSERSHRIQTENKPDTSQVESSATDPKAKRKQMKYRQVSTTERQVTDPVTHLPISIRDFSDADLKEVRRLRDGEEKELQDDGGVEPGSGEEYEAAVKRSQSHHDGMKQQFPSPDFQWARDSLAAVYSRAVLYGLGSLLFIFCLWVVLYLFAPTPKASEQSGVRSSLNVRNIWVSGSSVISLILATITVSVISGWVQNKARRVWEDSLWEAQRRQVDK